MSETMMEQDDEFEKPLLILDISKVEQHVLARRVKDRSKSEERTQFRLHVVFRKNSDVLDFQRKKDWVFDSELKITKSRYMALLKMFKESLEGIEQKPSFITFASKYFDDFQK